MAVKIAIANMKGGIGKTTTALCLADEFQKHEKNVLVIDMDPQRSATGVYGAKIEDTNTLADLMYEKTPAIECIQHTQIGDIIASDPLLMEADTKIPVDADRFYHLSDACKEIEDQYDIILFDCPPGNGVMLGNVLSCANGVIMPITCDRFGVQGMIEFVDVMNQYINRINPGLKILGVLRVQYEENQILTKDLEENLIPNMVAEMGTKLYKTKIRKCVKCKQAQALGIRLSDYAPNCTTAQDYDALVKELFELEEV